MTRKQTHQPANQPTYHTFSTGKEEQVLIVKNKWICHLVYFATPVERRVKNGRKRKHKQILGSRQKAKKVMGYE